MAQIIQILLVEGTERGFDRGAEAGYTMPNTLAEKRDPDAVQQNEQDAGDGDEDHRAKQRGLEDQNHHQIDGTIVQEDDEVSLFPPVQGG